MRKITIIPLFLLMIIITLNVVSASTLYQEAEINKPTLYGCDTDGISMYADIGGTVKSINQNFDTVTNFQTFQDTNNGIFVYLWNTTNNITFDNHLITKSFLKIDNENVYLILEWDSGYVLKRFRTEDDSSYNVTEFIGAKDASFDRENKELYVLYSNNVVKVYTITTASFFQYRPVYQRTIILSPIVNTDTITIKDGYIYSYGNTFKELSKMTLTGQFLETIRSDIQNNNIEEACFYNDKWYLIGNETAYRMSFESQNTTFEYIAGEYVGTTDCIDETHLCLKPQWFDNGGIVDSWCNIDDIINCDAPCLTNTTNYNGYAVDIDYCGVASCESECEFEGYTECINSQTMRTCGNYDNDLCLEFTPPTACLENQICGGYGACIDINYSQYGVTTSYPDFFVHTKIKDDTNIKYNILSSSKLQVETNYALHNQKYSITTNPPDIDIFGNIDCDYKETVYLDHSFDDGTPLPDYVNGTTLTIEKSDNTGLKVLKIPHDALLQSSVLSGLLIVKLDINQKDFNKDSTTTISYGGSEYDYLDLIMVHNHNLKTFSFYKNTVTPENLLFVTDAYIGNDKVTSLKEMEITTTFNINDGLVDVYLNANFDDGVTIYTQKEQTTPFYKKDEFSNYFDRVVFNSNQDLYVSNFKVYKPNNLPNMIAPQYLDEALTCDYTSLGCYNVRIYGNGNDLPLYNNYQDKEICINSLGKSKDDVITEIKEGSVDDFLGQIKNLSLVGQLLLLVLTVGLTSIFFFAVGESDNIKKTIGIIIVGFEILLFVLIGIIPVWFVVLIMIIVAMITTKLARNIFFGGS